MWAQCINALLGLWLIVAPAFLGAGGATSGRVVGPVILASALTAAWEPTRPLRWITLLGGVWLLIGPWFIKLTGLPLLNSLVVGLAIVALALVGAPYRPWRYGGGWGRVIGMQGGKGAPEADDTASGDDDGASTPRAAARGAATPADDDPPTRGATKRSRQMGADGTRQVVVITGASAGVGRATAIRFGQAGAAVALLARGEAGLEGAWRDVEAAGGRALAIPTDVADPEAVEAAAARIERELGPIDVWVNNAMVSVFSPFKEMEATEFRRTTEVTYLGQVYGTMAALKRMLPRDRGTVVHVGSALAYRGIPLQSAYCGAKHAIQGFTESVRAELLHDGSNVRVTMVQMPALNTTQFGWVKSRLPHQAQPVPPIYQPEVAAGAIFHASYHYRPEWFVGASTSIVITGNKALPSVGDHYLARTGIKSQQTDQPRDPQAPNNLWQPVDDEHDHGAHGTFDAKAKGNSVQFWLSQRRGALGAVVGVVGVAVVGLARRLRA